MKLLRSVLIDYIRFYYLGLLEVNEIKNAILVFEALLEGDENVEDYITIIRQMQFELDMVIA
jgi:hypothetical protein